MQNSLELRLTKYETILPTLVWTFSDCHFSLTWPSAMAVTSLGEGLLGGLRSAEQTLSFAHACIYASLGASYGRLSGVATLRDHRGSTAFYAMPLTTESNMEEAARCLVYAFKGADGTLPVLSDQGAFLGTLLAAVSERLPRDEGAILNFLQDFEHCPMLASQIFARQTTPLGVFCALKLVLSKAFLEQDKNPWIRELYQWVPQREPLSSLSQSQASKILETILPLLCQDVIGSRQQRPEEEAFVQRLLDQWPEDHAMLKSFISSSPLVRLDMLLSATSKLRCTRLLRRLHDIAYYDNVLKICDASSESCNSTLATVARALTTPWPSNDERERQVFLTKLCQWMASPSTLERIDPQSAAVAVVLVPVLIETPVALHESDVRRAPFDELCRWACQRLRLEP